MNELRRLTIFYDGKCHLCSREMKAYKKRDKKGLLDFVNIVGKEFELKKEELNFKDVNKVLHVRKADGSIVKGVDAFIEIWNILEMFSIMSFLAKHQPTRSLFLIGYFIFAKFRHFLPQRDCSLDD